MIQVVQVSFLEIFVSYHSDLWGGTIFGSSWNITIGETRSQSNRLFTPQTSPIQSKEGVDYKIPL